MAENKSKIITTTKIIDRKFLNAPKKALEFNIWKSSPAFANAQSNGFLLFDMLRLRTLPILSLSHLCLYLCLFLLDQLGLVEMFKGVFSFPFKTT
jgi:hypothetical protein